MTTRFPLLSSMLLATALAVGCGDSTSSIDPPAATKNIVETAVAAGNFGTLAAALTATGLDATLKGAGPFTVFAPDDAAFAKLPAFLSAQLLTAPYKTELSLILGYHVVAGDLKAAGLLGKTQDLATAAAGGAKLKVDGSNSKVVLNGSVNVSTADVAASNGTIHVIDGVLLPSIADTVAGYKDGSTEFKTLLAALGAADLASIFSGPGTFTVFAPTDAAFAALKAELGAPAFDALLANKTKLTRVLKYHVLGATAYAKDVQSGQVDTLAGGTDKLTLTVAGGKVTIADGKAGAAPANVAFTDLPNRNGVIHVIDRVLVPANL